MERYEDELPSQDKKEHSIYSEDCYIDFLLDNLIEEYVLRGYSNSMILDMFRSPWYKEAHSVYCRKDEAYVTMHMRKVRKKVEDK